MPLITALLSMLSRRIGALVRAVFGWVILGLFGRLSTAKSTALSVALILSLAWPLLVVGVFAPGVAAQALSFVPLQRWIGMGVLRGVWIGLAIAAPLVVGVITRWAAPDRRLHGSVWRTLWSGFPLTLGFAISFLITLIVVPFSHAMAILRRRSDEHVFLQVREGAYRRVLDELCAICDAADIPVREEPVPTAMGLATRCIKWFARGSLDAIVPDDPRMLRGDDIEIYLYPADLFLRGDKVTVARFRAAMVKRMPLDAAYQTSEPPAQETEEELRRLWEIVLHHDRREDIGGPARGRLRAVTDELDQKSLPYDQWMLLYANLHRLERAICGGPNLVDQAPVLPEKKGLTMPTSDVRTDASTAELVREALQETKELARLEIELAKTDIRQEMNGAKAAAVGFGVAAALGLVALALLLSAAALAIAVTPVPLLVFGIVLAVAAGVGAALGYRKLPKAPLARTMKRLQTDARILKEKTA